MPFDAAGFDGRGRPAPERDPWGALSLFLLRLALLLARAAVLGIVFIFVAYAVAVATGNGPQCVVHAPFQACR